MPKPSALIATAVLLSVACASACRFNVRDVGFVDLGSEPYRYYCFIDAQTPAEQAEAIRQVAGAAFLDANVAASVIDLEAPEDPGALAHYRLAGSPGAPTAVLVSPDGARALAMPLVDEEVILQESLWLNMERVYGSPAQDAVVEKAIETYGVIVLVEGEDATENARVLGAANDTVKRIAAALGKLEKAIQKPPVIHVISAADASKERVFLWSLDIDADNRRQPAATVLYGRGRQIGSVLEGAAITGPSLFNIAGTIGLNCECGLERKWMQGSMIPTKWEDDRQKLVAKLLGFDAEDPKIKMEMSQILSKGENARGKREGGASAISAASIDALLSGYEEVNVSEQPRPDPDREPVPTTPAASQGEPESTEEEAAGGALLSVFILGALALVVLLGGAIIAVRGRSQNG